MESMCIAGIVLSHWKEVVIDETLNIINIFKNVDSSDVYGITTMLLKKVAPIIVLPLTNVVNGCLRKGNYPEELELARTVPVNKKGETGLLENYRPNSIIPILGKVVENVKKIQMTDLKSPVFTVSTWFRGGKSTLTAVLDLCQHIYEIFDETESVLLILREFIVEGIRLLLPQCSPRQTSALWGGWRGLRHVNLILRMEKTNGVHLSCFIWDSGVDAWSPT